MIDWNSNETHIICNPRKPGNTPKLPLTRISHRISRQARQDVAPGSFTNIREHCSCNKARIFGNEDVATSCLTCQKGCEKCGLKGHIWLQTSGTTGMEKWVALSKEAFLISAEAVNRHLQSGKEDHWLNPLPSFHVGGLGIYARAFLSGAKISELKKWDPQTFYEIVQNNNITLTSLVPAQVYDLVKANLTPPSSLRGIIVGGGAMNKFLTDKAISCGWPIIPSYGLTECCSQVATATIKSRNLQILSHIDLRIDSEGHICIKSKALLTTYAIGKNYEMIDPKINGELITEDFGYLENGFLVVKGRGQNFIKIGGESVDLKKLENILQEIIFKMNLEHDYAVFPSQDERLGHVIHLATTSNEKIDEIVSRFQIEVMPFEKIRQVHIMEKIPRSPLGKLLLSQDYSSNSS